MIEWNVLNIEETTDEEAITNAYRRMLTVTNPVENPSGFMLLRNTYEQAIAYAKAANMGTASIMNSQQAYSPADNMFEMSMQPMMNTNVVQPQEEKKVDLDKTVVIENISDIIRKNLNKGSGVPFATKDNLEKPAVVDSTVNSDNVVHSASAFNNTGLANSVMEVKPLGSGFKGITLPSHTHMMGHEQSNSQMYLYEEDNQPMLSAENEMGNQNFAGEMPYASEHLSNQISSEILKEVTVDEQSLLQQWIDRIEGIYYDFASRISEDMWNEVLTVPLCIEEDTKPKASELLLRFLMKHYYLPQNIWQIIDKTFSYAENKDELLKKYPREFIEDVVLSSINYPDIINYYMFRTDLQIDYDQFIYKFFQIVRFVRQNQYEEAYMALVEIDAYGSVHPYVEVERVKYLISVGQYQDAMNIAHFLYETYPDDASIVYIRAEIAWAVGNVGEARIYYQKLLTINSEHYYAKIGLADCYMQEKEFEKAKDLYAELREINPYDSYVIENLDAANENLISLFEENIKKDKSDVRSMLKLAWCYIQNDDIEKAIKIGKALEQIADPYDYCNVLGKAYLQSKDYKNAIKYLEKWVSTIRNIPRNGNRENKLKYGRLGGALELLGQAYEQANMTKKALNLYKMAKKEEPHNINHRISLARYLIKIGKDEDCVYECEEILKIDNRDFEAAYYRAVALYNLEYLSKALDAFDECIRLYQFDVNSYVYKIRILMRYCEFDKIEEIFEFLDANCIGSEIITFYKTKMSFDKEVIEQTKNKSEDMIDYDYFIGIYEGLIKNYKKGTSDIDDADPIYLEIAKLYVNIGNYKKSLTVLKNIHSKDKTNIEVYECMAISLEKLEKYKGALESYKRILLLCPEHREANIKIAELLEKQEQYDEAIKFHTKQLEITKSISGFINRGKIYLKLDDFQAARKDFKEAIKMNPYNPNSYNWLGVTYMYECNFEEAKKNFLQAIDRLEQERTPEPYRNLALIYTKIGDFEKAVDCYKANIEYFNDSYDYEKIAEIYYEQKEYKKSVEAYNKRCKVIENADELTNTELYVWVGKCNTGLESEKTALKYYTKAIETAKVIGTKCHEAYIEIAKMYMQIDKYELAMKFFKEAAQSPKMSIENKIEYAYCCFVSNNFEEGQKYSNIALAEAEKMSENINGEKIKKHYLMGYAYLVQNQIEKAQECINEAFKCRTCNDCFYPKCHRAIALQGLVLEKKGNRGGAIKCLGDALALVPGNAKYIHDFSRVKE
ncbi:MAG: tetratricopeptide repeat protein [Lachnospiraceae bacterium]|nr:tetratricopeptide repeat protein [Lachnospiraceae bacterium]